MFFSNFKFKKLFDIGRHNEETDHYSIPSAFNFFFKRKTPSILS